MGEAENLTNAAQALTTAAQQYTNAASECTNVTGGAVSLGMELKTTWQGKASAAFMSSLDKLSGDSYNLMGAFNEAAAVMNGLALAIQANLGPISTAEKLQQQYGSNLPQLPASYLQQYNEVQGAAETALTTITYLANSAAGSLEAVTSVGVCSTGLGVMNADITTTSKDGKTTFSVDGKPLLVVDDATGAILENNTGGGGGTNPPTPPTGGGGNGRWWEEGWWHDWWSKDANIWQKTFMRLLIGSSVSGVSNGANTIIQHKPWSWPSFLIQGALLSGGYEASLWAGFKGPVDKIFSALVSAAVVGLVHVSNGRSNIPHPTPGPAPTSAGAVTARPTSKPTSTPTPSLSPMPSPSSSPTYAPIH